MARRSSEQESQYEWLEDTPSAGGQDRLQNRHLGSATSNVVDFLGILRHLLRMWP